MSSRQSLFQQYANAVDALRTFFGDRGDALYAHEIQSQYEFTTTIDDTDWLKEHLAPLADCLLQAQFRIHLIVTVYDTQVKFTVLNSAELEVNGIEFLEVNVAGLNPSAVGSYEAFRSACEASPVGMHMSEVVSRLEDVQRCGIRPDLSFQVFLDKNRVNQILTGTSQASRVISYLFPEALAAMLERISLSDLEKEFFSYGQRTTFPVFGHTGKMEGPYLALFGRGDEAGLDAFIDAPLPPVSLQNAKRTLEMRQSAGVWLFPTTWLTPASVDFDLDIAGDTEITARLRRQLNVFRALLSILFLADLVEIGSHQYWVEFKGYSRQRFLVSREALLEHETGLEKLYQLYTYAYEGFSLDKVEIAQQFLSLMATDLDALCSNAIEVRDAAKVTYDRTLAKQVEDYFESRHKVQERIKTAVAETSTSMIELSREVSEDVYKIIGVIILGVAGSLLKPELTLWAGLGVAIAIMGYMVLVIFFHLRTIKQAFGISMEQHKAYIQSYGDILYAGEVQNFEEEKHLEDAKNLFTTRVRDARWIYLAFLIISLLVVVITGVMLMTAAPPASSEPAALSVSDRFWLIF